MLVNELDIVDGYGRSVMIDERNEEATEEQHLAARITGALAVLGSGILVSCGGQEVKTTLCSLCRRFETSFTSK